MNTIGHSGLFPGATSWARKRGCSDHGTDADFMCLAMRLVGFFEAMGMLQSNQTSRVLVRRRDRITAHLNNEILRVAWALDDIDEGLLSHAERGSKR
jgi:hypothetical protein